MDIIKLHSIFNSIQGEGLDIGKPTTFVRLAGCPFRCPYCDEPQAQTTKNATKISFIDLAEKIAEKSAYGNRLIEFTGGSPEAQPELFEFVRYMKDNFSINCNFTIQISGGIPIEKDDIGLFFRVKADYKNEVLVGFKNRFDYTLLNCLDEIKFVIDTYNINEDLKLVLDVAQYTEAKLIITSMTKSEMSLIQEIKSWKYLTESVMENEDFEKYMNRIVLLPRLQQLYWPNIKNK